jgi:hypothetical protein
MSNQEALYGLVVLRDPSSQFGNDILALPTEVSRESLRATFELGHQLGKSVESGHGRLLRLLCRTNWHRLTAANPLRQ